MSALALSVSAVRAGSTYRRAQTGRGLLVRGFSPTGAPRPGCCCAPLGARVMSEQIGPGRLSGPPRLGTVTADCPTKTALFATYSGRRVLAVRVAMVLRCTPRFAGAGG